MATGAVLTVLANIPWSKVAEKAPIVVDGAMKIWNAVGSRRNSSTATLGHQQKPEAKPDFSTLYSDIDALRQNISFLNDQMQASATLIKDLAEQNSILVQKIDILRLRHLIITLATGILSVCSLLLAGYILYFR